MRRPPAPRAAHRVFLQDPAAFEPLIHRLPVADPWCRTRVRTIVEAFLEGYNAMASAGDPTEVHDRLAGLDPYFSAFAYEGAAMGFGPWALLRGAPAAAFEPVIGALTPRTVYQNYVGRGWWLAVRHRRRPRAIERAASGLDHRYRLLVHEGAGFRDGLLSAGDPVVLARHDRASPAARHVAHQGFGRSLWFSRMGDPEALSALVEGLAPDVRGDCYSGAGLACAFAWLDRGDSLPGIAAALPEQARPDFWQGAAFGWEARSLADPRLFATLTDALPAVDRDRAHTAVSRVRDARDELDACGTTRRYYQAWRAATRARLVAGRMATAS